MRQMLKRRLQDAWRWNYFFRLSFRVDFDTVKRPISMPSKLE